MIKGIWREAYVNIFFLLMGLPSFLLAGCARSSFPILYQGIDRTTAANHNKAVIGDYLPTLFYFEKTPACQTDALKLEKGSSKVSENRTCGFSLLRFPGDLSFIGLTTENHGKPDRLKGNYGHLNRRFSYLFFGKHIYEPNCKCCFNASVKTK